MSFELDNIKIPKDLDQIIEKAIEEGTEYKDQQKKSRSKKWIIAAATLAIIITVNFNNSAFAEGLPFIGRVFKEVNFLVNEAEYTKYAQSIDAQSTYKDITVKVDEAVCTDDSLFISVIINNNNGFSRHRELNKERSHSQFHLKGLARVNFEKYYNDDYQDIYKKISLGKKYKEGFKELFTSRGAIGNFVDDNTFIGVIKYDLSSLNTEIPENFKVKLDINNLDYGYHTEEFNEDQLDFKGIWNLEFDVRKAKNGEFKTITPNNISDGDPKDISSNKFKVEKLTVNPFETNLVITVPKELERAIDKPTIVDDEGKAIFMENGQLLKKDHEKITYLFNYGAIDKNAKYINVVLGEGTKQEKIKIKLEN